MHITYNTAAVVALDRAPSVENRQLLRQQDPDLAALAALAMSSPEMTIKAIVSAGAADETLRRMARLAPGAVEALWRCDAAPRSFRLEAEEALEEAGWIIQH
jgi:hypothetical protein